MTDLDFAKMVKQERRPYLQAALICERVMQEKDGVISAIRISDGVIHAGLLPFNHALTVLAIIRSGSNEQAIVPVRVDMETPSGVIILGASWNVLAQGQNLIGNMQLTFKENGLHWFNIYVDNELVNKMPFRVVSKGESSRGEEPSPAGSGIKVSDFVKGEIY